ncbi:MAG: PcfJ domain-containing protein [Bacteroidales bacterium]|nr:PcfJ domain-containing protein [Lachnoclostridium sp.]MCM1385146.1 PcfJ domain-containing protein [Lachnoclostridium sp.]MCM1465548.1 PcfJ domain-containing protein [Bacteroidales bacterium]
MKKVTIESTLPKEPPEKKMGWWVTVQDVKDTIVFNIYHNRILQNRHCFCLGTKEYATLSATGKWEATKIETALGIPQVNYMYYYDAQARGMIQTRFHMSEETKQHLFEKLEPLRKEYLHGISTRIIDTISRAETEYQRERKQKTEHNRILRVNAMMSRIPDIPRGIYEWIDRMELKGMDFFTHDRGSTKYTCSNCGGQSELDDIKKVSGKKKILHKDMAKCPKCGKNAQILKFSHFFRTAHFSMIQPVDDEISVMRYFTAHIKCAPGAGKEIEILEDIRVLFLKNVETGLYKEESCYYEQMTRPSPVPDGGETSGYFDNMHNPANKKSYPGYLYDGGIEEALTGTEYGHIGKLFSQLAAAGIKMCYTSAMLYSDTAGYIRMIEMLFRGRFYKLLEEFSRDTYRWSTLENKYYGTLNVTGKNINEVFRIQDRQLINRIRDRDGGEHLIKWMWWSEEHKQKISDRVLDWLTKNDLKTDHLQEMLKRFTVEQAMNYLERQKRESYRKMTIKQILDQYEDYLEMCRNFHKNIEDEMVYRPRELKRRHDEMVLLTEKQEAQIQADEYTKKYAEAEAVLQSIREKYEYAGEKFFIVVPSRIVDIVLEGRMLHHCAGATDRYFDRIKQNETYICFLRRKEEPDMPFYTIEVEPGGTIRQHRGMYDEEPDIDEVKPFLREWQKEIRKRMSKEDHKLAAASKTKREENIAELREKNNTRVLQGLMEDFMEAM